MIGVGGGDGEEGKRIERSESIGERGGVVVKAGTQPVSLIRWRGSGKRKRERRSERENERRSERENNNYREG